MKVLVTDPIHEDGIKALGEIAEVDVAKGLGEEELRARIADADVLVVRSATKVTKDLLSVAKNLKLIVRAGTGLDNIDIVAARERGIKVLNTPEAPSVATAELAMALMLAWARKIVDANLSMKQGKWEKSKLRGTELRGKTLGIIGTGRVGREVGRRAKAFGMKLLLNDIVEIPEFAKEVNSRYVDLETLLRESDYVSIHVPLTKETERMIDEEKLRMMKPTAVLINTARGGVVDEKALVKALKSGEIAGACLDVYEKEPLGDSPLLELPNVILTPHLGASTEEAQRRAALLVVEKVKKELCRERSGS
ncbi:MAG: hypothetical protein J7J17_01295 [Hadesarchaea archaeon]|nr:hypothetical protein [Hadesarchaea archaeon]